MLKEKDSGDFWQRRILRNELILRSAGEGIFGIDVTGKISFVNPAAGIMLQQQTSNLVGKHYQTVLFAGQDGEFADVLEFSPIQFALTDGETSHVNSETFYRSNGTDFLAEYICVPLKEKDAIIGAVITFQDITERRDIETAIVDARNAAIESARTKTEFLANMSHEIRTPLNGVIGMTTLLLDTKLSHEQLHYTNIIKQSADLLLEIVNEILDFSKLEAGKLEIENIDFELPELLKNTVDFFKIETERKNLQLELNISDDVPNMICGDSTRLRQILFNLIGNAIKFTSEGKVTISVNKSNNNADKIVLKFTVVDSGIGISPEIQQNLFLPFTQADASTTRRFGGTGLGLAICKQLAQMMNGEIGVNSKLNNGSEFWFTAEFGKVLKAQAATVGNSSNIVSQTDRHNLKLVSESNILVAEDNDVNKQVALGMLRSLGFQADAVINGIEAVNAVKSKDYALVLMDCHMPEMDGFEAVREIRSIPNLKNIPKIVAMTATAIVAENEFCINNQMDDYLLKPMSKENLARILSKHLTTQEKKLDSATNIVQHCLEDVLDKHTLENLRQIELRGEKNFVGETIKLYINHATVQIDEMKTAVANWNAADLRLKAHSLKGSSGSIGLVNMFKLCESLESSSLNDDKFLSEKIFSNILTEFDRIKELLASCSLEL